MLSISMAAHSAPPETNQSQSVQKLNNLYQSVKDNPKLEKAWIEIGYLNLELGQHQKALEEQAAFDKRRADAKADRFEAEDLSFHQGLRKAFLQIAAREPQRCAVIDAAQSPDDVAKSIRDVVTTRLQLQGAA